MEQKAHHIIQSLFHCNPPNIWIQMERLHRTIFLDPDSHLDHDLDHFALFGALNSRAALTNSYPNTGVLNTEAVCTIFMIFLGMTWLGHKPMI